MYSTIIFLILLLPNIVFGASLPTHVIEAAKKDVNVVIEKTNSNDHPRIDQYCKNVGIPLHSPYCAAGVYTWYKEGSIAAGVKNPAYQSGSSGQVYYAALKNPMRFKFIKPYLVKMGSIKLNPADIVLWSDNPQFTRGHVGMVEKQVSNTTFNTIEANTSPSNLVSEQREQTKKSLNKGGVYRKSRTISSSPKFETRAFVRPIVKE